MLRNTVNNLNYATENPPDFEEHLKNMHYRKDIQTIESDEIKPTGDILKCNLCNFTTRHHPGFKSHTTRMHGEEVKYSCLLCSERFETKKILKSHIYCIHSGKYKTLAQYPTLKIIHFQCLHLFIKSEIYLRRILNSETVLFSCSHLNYT